MKFSFPQLSIQKHADTAAAAVFGFILIYNYTSISGIGVSPDSVAYASVARFLQQGQFFMQFDKMPLIVFPFFYPTFLSTIMGITGNDVFVTAPAVNALLFALLITLTGHILQTFTVNQTWLKRAALCVLIFSTSLTEIFCMLWSETLFIVLSACFMNALHRYFVQRTIWALLLAAFIAALACVTRFAGVTFIAVGGAMLLFDKAIPWGKKWLQILLFGLVSISLLIGNLVRNYYAEGTLTGDRQKGITPLKVNIQYAANVICDWFQVSQKMYPIAFYVSLLFLGFIVFSVLKNWMHQQRFYTYPTIAALFFIVYSCFLVITATLSRYETINNRLLSPAYLPLLLTLSSWWPSFQQKLRPSGRWLAISAGLLLFAYIQWFQIHHATQWYAEIKADGLPGYNEMAWKRSPIIHYLHEHKNDFKKEVPLYSNANDAVYFFTGLACETIPENVHYTEIKEYYHTEPHYVIWFTNDFDNPDLLRPQEINKYRQLDTLQHFSDGVILWSH